MYVAEIKKCNGMVYDEITWNFQFIKEVTRHKK